jgi:AcrR family transcriptional regulator
VDAAEQILREEGFVAVSARRVAERAGLKPQLVHYYFETMDDLLLAVVRRVNVRRRERHAQAEASDRPLHAIWEMSTDSTSAGLMAEITSLAIHREAIREEVVRSATEFRDLQTRTIARIFEGYGVDAETYPPGGVVLLMSAISRVFVSEVAVGLLTGHAEAQGMVKRLLDTFEPPAT